MKTSDLNTVVVKLLMISTLKRNLMTLMLKLLEMLSLLRLVILLRRIFLINRLDKNTERWLRCSIVQIGKTRKARMLDK